MDDKNLMKKNDNYKNINTSSYIHINNNQNSSPIEITNTSVVTKNITIEVSNDFDSSWFLNKATPIERTEILLMGELMFRDCAPRLANHTIKDKLNERIEYELEKCRRHFNQIMNEKDKQIVEIKSQNNILQDKVLIMEPKIKEMRLVILKNEDCLYKEKREYKDKLRVKFEERYRNLKEELKEYRNRLDKTINNNREREDRLRDKYQTEIDTIREKYDRISSIYCNSSRKGEAGEVHVNDTLHSLLPTAIITDTHKEPERGDFHISYENVGLLYENKNYDSKNVPKKEVNKFLRDVEINNDCECGILASQKRGIAARNNFTIEYTKNNKPVIYLHETLKNHENIKFAVEILVSMIKNNVIIDNSKMITIKKSLDTCLLLKKNNYNYKRTLEQLLKTYKENSELINELEKDIKRIIKNDVCKLDDENQEEYGQEVTQKIEYDVVEDISQEEVQ